DGGLDGFGEIGVVEDDAGGFSTELEGDALDGLRGELGDALAGAGRAGERDHVDAGVLGDGFADGGTVAAHEIEDTGGELRLVDDLGEDEGIEGRDLAGLEDDRAAGGEGGGHLRADLVERVVPRRDAADDADG